MGGEDATKWAVIEVVNVGERPEIVIQGHIRYYQRWIDRFGRRPNSRYVNNVMGEIPTTLQPGDRWTGKVAHQELLDRLGKCGYLFLGIAIAGMRGPIYRRVYLDRVEGP
jgi:hypothetical protein